MISFAVQCRGPAAHSRSETIKSKRVGYYYRYGYIAR